MILWFFATAARKISTDATAHPGECQAQVVPQKEFSSAALFFDDAAGDPIARVAGRVAHQVVGLLVNYQRGAAFVEERIRAIS
jgi:hypothetical protein